MKLRTPAIASTSIVAPFLVVELASNAASRSGSNASAAQYALDTTVLFGILWLLALAFVASVVPLVRRVRAGGALEHPIGAIGLVFVVLLSAAAWGAIVLDQLPAILGMPNAD